MATSIKTDVFHGSGHPPERDSHVIEQHALATDPYGQPSRVPSDKQLGPDGRVVIQGESEEKASLIPERETEDYPTLAAWYSGYSFAEHYRKVVQAQCQEIVRAKGAVDGQKLTEARIEALARLHPIYLDYLATHLRGRILWEAEYRAAGGLP